MEPISASEIVRAVKGQIINGKGECCFDRISINSNDISSGDLFIALKGKRFDGHNFVLDALARGASGAIVSHDFFPSVTNTDVVLISVDDTGKALGDLAAYYRQKLHAHLIAVTGSNGKTTTKDIIHHLLSQCARVAKSPESFNNVVGVPLTIFELDRQTDFGVIEMGTNARGEIRRLSEIVRPQTAVITNISETHLEGLGSIEGVANEKGELLSYIDDGGTLVINADNVWCNRIANSFSGRIVRFGINNEADIKSSSITRTDSGLSFVVNNKFRVDVPFHGMHNVYNCLAAFGVCQALSFDIEDLSKSILHFRLPSMRMGRLNIGDITIVNDAYNASPQSMMAALNEYREMQVRGRKIFICGDMLELGSHAERLHKEVGAKVAHSGIDMLVAVGELSRYVAEAACVQGMEKERVLCYDSLDEAIASVVHSLEEDDTVLLKGSRRMRLERIIERVQSFFLNTAQFGQGEKLSCTESCND